jgi:hypothetical protein
MKLRNDWRGKHLGDVPRKHQIHHPGGEQIVFEPNRRVVDRMIPVLEGWGWTIQFTVRAVSPRGFEYQAQGRTPEQTLLTAFSQWKREMGNIDGVNRIDPLSTKFRRKYMRLAKLKKEAAKQEPQ